MSYHIECVASHTEEIQQAFEKLAPQLADIPVPSQAHLSALIDSSSSHLFVARCEATQEIVGTITLATYLIPTDTRAWIEDVIVDASQRGKGLGKLMMQHAEDYARSQGISMLNLSSNPARVAANQLYQKIGYQARETNVYRKSLP